MIQPIQPTTATQSRLSTNHISVCLKPANPNARHFKCHVMKSSVRTQRIVLHQLISTHGARRAVRNFLSAPHSSFRMKLSSATIKLINLALRGAQLVLSVVAMATVAAAFENNDAYPTSYRLGSHNTNFLLLMTYSSFMYSLWYIACVELGGLATRPRKLLSRAMDTVLAVFLLSAAIAVAASDYVTKCDSYDLLIRCDTLTSAVTVACLSVMPLVGSFGLTYVESSTDEELDMTPTVYEQQSTPKAGGAYGQMPPTPSTKV